LSKNLGFQPWYMYIGLRAGSWGGWVRQNIFSGNR